MPLSERRGSPWTGLGTVIAKEMADHLSGARMVVIEALVYLVALVVAWFSATNIRESIGESPFLFLRLLTIAPDPIPFSFIGMVELVTPIIAIALGFDAINSEFNQRTLSRILAQPIYRDALLFGKFLARLLSLSVALVSLWLLVLGLGFLRLGLAEVLMKEPSVAILDEPTTALDPHSTQEFLEMIRGLKSDGTAVLLSSHHLDQVQRVCDRVALFNRGRIALSGTVTELASQVLGGGYVIDVEAEGANVPELLAAIPGVVRVQPLGGDRFRVDGQRDLRVDIAHHLSGSAELIGLYHAAPSLNEVYARYFAEARDAVR